MQNMNVAGKITCIDIICRQNSVSLCVQYKTNYLGCSDFNIKILTSSALGKDKATKLYADLTRMLVQMTFYFFI